MFILVSCADPEVEANNRYVFVKPINFPEPTYTFDNNPVTKEGFLLGKRIFFDPILSRDGSVACSNCHQQGTAFADAQQHAFSRGVDEQLGARNAPSLANMAFYKEFLWDGGITHLDFVPTNAITSEVEMDETMSNVVGKLNNIPEYKNMFKEAFGVEEVTSPYMLYALSQFTLMMVSANSRYDKYVRGEGEMLSTDELAGLEIFEEKCATCHSGELFSDFTYRNNGLSETFTDLGRGRITENSNQEGKFRVPSLRNVELTAPYMHNAKFSTLEEVLDHYEAGMVDSPTLDPSFQSDSGLGVSLTSDEKEKIITFLKTLTDREFVTDARFFNDL